MAMKSFKITLISLLACATIISSVGCSNGAEKEKGQSNSAASETNQEASGNSESEKIDPLAKYENPIEVSVFGVSGNNVTFAPGEDQDNNVVSNLFKDKLGIVFKNKWVVDQAKVDEKVNLAIASNDLPDITRVDINQMKRMIDNGQAEDLSPYYDKYASDLLKNAMEYGDGKLFVPSSRDGKIYGMPLPFDYYEHVPIVYIRKDWLDKLHLEVPKTVDDFVQVAKAFTEQDPDGNGKADTYGFGLDKDLQMSFDAIASSYKAYRQNWVKDANGNLVYGSIQPQMKEALSKLREMYTSKVIDIEFGAKDWGRVAEDSGAGKIGMYTGAFWSPLYPLRLTKDHAPNSDWIAVSIPVGADGTVVPKNLPNTTYWAVVRKGASNPEALIKSMNLWAELWLGEGSLSKLLYEDLQGSDKYKNVELNLYAKPYFFDAPDKNINVGKQFRDAMEKDDPSLVTHPDGKNKWKQWKDGSSLGWGYMKYLTESELVLTNYKDQYQNNEFFAAPTPTMEKRKAMLDKLELESFTKIISGNVPVDEFDTFVEQWKKLGGDQVTTEVNDWAKTQK
jgi:putative aldouronate transport system substrate-binding protein